MVKLELVYGEKDYSRLITAIICARIYLSIYLSDVLCDGLTLEFGMESCEKVVRWAGGGDGQTL